MGIGRNTLIGLATDGAIFILGLVVSVVLTQSLGPLGIGVYAILITTNVILANVAHLSIGIACSTLLAGGRYRLGEVNTWAVLLALGMGLICIGGATLLYPLLQDNVFQGVTYPHLLVALLLIPATIYQVYWSYMMMGLNRLLVLNKLNLAVNICSAALMIGVVGVLHAGISGFLMVWSASAVIGAVGNLILAVRIEPFVWPPRRIVLRDLVSFGLRSHGANIAHNLFLRFDMFAVNALVGTTGAGLYSRSTSLAEKIWLLLNAIHASSLGKIAELPKAESALLTAKVTRTAVLMMLIVALPFALVSPWLVPLLYGPAFAPSVLPLIVLLAGVLGFAVMLVVNSYILGQMQRPGLLSVISWLQLGVSIPLYLALIGWQGIVGAAVASTLTYLLAMVCTLWVFTRDSGLPVHQVLIPQVADFRDYARVVGPVLRKLRGLRHATRPAP